MHQKSQAGANRLSLYLLKTQSLTLLHVDISFKKDSKAQRLNNLM